MSSEALQPPSAGLTLKDGEGFGDTMSTLAPPSRLTWKQLAELYTRLAHSSFPPELLIRVIEEVVESHVSYWKATYAGDLPTLAGKLFAWPGKPHFVAPNIRILVQRIASEALLKLSAVGSLVTLAQQKTLLLAPVLEDNEHRLRRLVLDVDTVPHNGMINRELNRIIRGMSILGTRFPRLKTCVFLLHFRNKEPDLVQRTFQ